MRYSLNGYTYRFIIDPILSKYYPRIVEEIDAGSSVIDIACGTGSLSLEVAGMVNDVTGIDLSEEMVEIASDTAKRKKINNTDFAVKDASDLSSFSDREFDVALMSMAVHQFNEELALKILVDMQRIASKIILMDYNYPLPPGISKLVISVIERIAGGNHYRNFRHFNALGGLDYFLEKSGLTPISEKLRKGSAFRIVVCS